MYVKYPNGDLAVHFFDGKIVGLNTCKDRNSTGGPKTTLSESPVK